MLHPANQVVVSAAIAMNQNSPYIYRCQLRLLEPTFFSTREVSDLYQTEAFVGHLALCYALGLAPSRYFNDGKTLHYGEDFAALNERGVYVTPATLVSDVRFTLGSFNAQPDTYWSAMGNNTLVTAPPGMWAERESQSWYLTDGQAERRKKGAENRPQFGRIRALAIDNRAEFYIISREPQELPRYFRLGKWMSKAHLETCTPVRVVGVQEEGNIPFLLAPADLPPDTELLAFDLLNVAPMPLVRHSRLRGPCYQLEGDRLIPCDMRFNVPVSGKQTKRGR
ncbi:MAG: type I-D CRISPR-associated protein Cas5/Csc1 [Chloroflexaceae bacterium]|nr:type I-D CRISPR-associated protein Cas5/Csc1 [Chloroflexaceae bacterium]